MCDQATGGWRPGCSGDAFKRRMQAVMCDQATGGWRPGCAGDAWTRRMKARDPYRRPYNANNGYEVRQQRPNDARFKQITCCRLNLSCCDGK